MPRYVFHCEDCGEEIEVTRKVDERDEPIRCKCGGEAVRVIARTAPPQFKGSGFTPKFYR